MAFHLDEKLVQSIQKIGQHYAIEQIVLFGSRARGDHKPTSDIDLAIFVLPEFNCRGRMTSDFDDLNTLLKIDTVFINEHIDPNYWRISRKKVSFYMSEPNTKVNNFSNALSRLKEEIAKYNEADDLLRDGVIQRFELPLSLRGKP